MSYRIKNAETGEILYSGLSYYEAELFREKHRNSDAYILEDEPAEEGGEQ